MMKAVIVLEMTEDLKKSFEEFLKWRNKWRGENKILKDGKLVDKNEST